MFLFKEFVLKSFILFLHPKVHFYLATVSRQYRCSHRGVRDL